MTHQGAGAVAEPPGGSMTPPSGRRRAAPIRAPASGGTIRPRPPAAGRADCPGKAIATAAAIARAPPPLAARRRSAGSVGTRGGVRLPAKAARPPWRGPAPPITAPARGDIRHAAARRRGVGSGAAGSSPPPPAGATPPRVRARRRIQDRPAERSGAAAADFYPSVTSAMPGGLATILLVKRPI